MPPNTVESNALLREILQRGRLIIFSGEMAGAIIGSLTAGSVSAFAAAAVA